MRTSFRAAYYNIQGRMDGQTRPLKPTSVSEPTELEQLITVLKTRFRTSAAEYVLQIKNFTTRMGDSVASTYATLNESATIVQEAGAMTEEQLAKRYQAQIP